MCPCTTHATPIQRTPISSPATTPVTRNSDSESEEGRMPTPLAGTPVAAPITEAVAKRVKRRPEADEPLPKRCATSCEGKILEIGTPKRFVKLYIHKKMLTIEGDQYLTAYSDKLTELKSMTIWKNNVQGFQGTASKWASTRFISCPTDIPGATRSSCSNWVGTNFMSYRTDIPGATRVIYSKVGEH